MWAPKGSQKSIWTSKWSVQLHSQKRYAAKPTLNTTEPMPKYTERRSIKACVTAKPTLDSAGYC